MDSSLSAGIKISLHKVVYDKIIEIDLSKHGVAFHTLNLDQRHKEVNGVKQMKIFRKMFIRSFAR